MPKKSVKKKAKRKSVYKRTNIYLNTTITAVAGTLVYFLVAYFYYASYVNYRNIATFFVVVWVVYFLITKYWKRN